MTAKKYHNWRNRLSTANPDQRNTRNLLLFVALAAVLSGTAPVSACRYNVRETGFVYLGIEPYRLFGYIDGETPAKTVTTFKTLAPALLAESNVQFGLLNVDNDPNHKALELLEDPNEQSYPTAVLLCPDGQKMQLNLQEPGGSFEQTLGTQLEKVLSSPMRKEILKQSASHYGAILLIEGPDPNENAQAAKAIQQANKAVEEQLDYLPKPIGTAPVQVTLKADSLAQEDVLLWTLGIEVEDVNAPLAAIFYGRGRWIGPLFRGPQINTENLLSVLYVVGGDCECGLDYRWVQGTMLPAEWDEDVHKLAVESLGFDPDNPMIRMEIGSIISRSLGPYAYRPDPFGYQEIVIESPTPDEGAMTEVEDASIGDQTSSDERQIKPEQRQVTHANAPPVVTQDSDVNAPAKVQAATSRDQAAESEDGGAAAVLLSARVMAGFAVGIVAVVILIGIAVFLRTRQA